MVDFGESSPLKVAAICFSLIFCLFDGLSILNLVLSTLLISNPEGVLPVAAFGLSNILITIEMSLCWFFFYRLLEYLHHTLSLTVTLGII